MKVAIYVRVSTDEQAVKGNSLSEQKERLYAYCKAMGWDEVDLFEDDGYSAKDMNRPKLQEMLDNVEQYSMIVTTKIDRLCRNLLDLLTVVDTLASFKCGYASSTESFDTSTPAGRMVLQILGAFAEFERERIRERVRDNLRSIVKKGGKKAVTRPCYGYDLVDGYYKINEEEAQNVRKMVEWTMEGEGAYKVAKRLNELGAKTKDGNLFSEGAVRKLLHRETISGDFVYNRRYNHKNKELIRPEEEWIVVENHHDPIIDKDTFSLLQDIMKSRGFNRKQADNERWLLSSLVVCEHCGSKMVGHYRNKGNKEYLKYVCAGYHKKAICFRHTIYRDVIEEGILNLLINSKEFFHGNKSENQKEERSNKVNDEQVLNDKLKKINSKMQKQIELYSEGDISKEDFRVARDKIDKERNEITEELKLLQRDSDELKQEEFLNKRNSLIGSLTSDDRLVVKNAIRMLVHKVGVRNGEHVELVVKS